MLLDRGGVSAMRHDAPAIQVRPELDVEEAATRAVLAVVVSGNLAADDHLHPARCSLDALFGGPWESTQSSTTRTRTTADRAMTGWLPAQAP